MSAQLQAQLLRQHLTELRKMKGDAERFYGQMADGVRGHQRTLKRDMQVADSYAFLLSCLGGIAKLTAMGAKSLKLTGTKIAQSNAKILKATAKQGVQKTRFVTGAVYKPENLLMELVLNYDSPSYWVEKLPPGINPYTMLTNLQNQIQRDKLQAMKEWNTFIKEAEGKLKACERGIDLSTMA